MNGFVLLAGGFALAFGLRLFLNWRDSRTAKIAKLKAENDEKSGPR